MKSKKKPKKAWQCSECGAMDRMCQHLENLLPKSSDNVKYSFRTNMDLFSSTKPFNLQDEEREMREKLKAFAMDEFRIDLLVLRFVYELTFAEIAEELNCPNVNTVFYAYSKAIKMLEERRFK